MQGRHKQILAANFALKFDVVVCYVVVINIKCCLKFLCIKLKQNTTFYLK